MPLDFQCQPIAAEIKALENERANAQEELRNAAPQEKPYWVGVIRELNIQIRRRNLDLDACNAAYPPTETPPPLTAYFNGTYAFVTTYDRAPGPYSGEVSGVLYFSGDRSFVRLIDLGTITTDPYETPFGSSTTTVSLDRTGGDTSGYYRSASGTLMLRIPLFVDHSVDVPLVVEDSTLVLLMTTNGVPGTAFGDLPGLPLDAAGRLVASGSGLFKDGILDGRSAGLTLDGTLTPHPASATG